jgi:hypothetical protein
MHVTVAPDGTGRLVVHGPHPAPAITPGGAAVTVAVCPVAAVDRTTGTLAHPYQYTAAGPVIAACPPRPPAADSVGDLNTATVAVCVHPSSHRMFVVGPFTGPDRAEQWWHARTNRFAETGACCHILPLTVPPGGAAEPTSGGPA